MIKTNKSGRAGTLYARVDRSIKLKFHVPVDTKYVILEPLFAANLLNNTEKFMPEYVVNLNRHLGIHILLIVGGASVASPSSFLRRSARVRPSGRLNVQSARTAGANSLLIYRTLDRPSSPFGGKGRRRRAVINCSVGRPAGCSGCCGCQLLLLPYICPLLMLTRSAAGRCCRS